MWQIFYSGLFFREVIKLYVKQRQYWTSMDEN
jgi:hypothetical protein